VKADGLGPATVDVVVIVVVDGDVDIDGGALTRAFDATTSHPATAMDRQAGVLSFQRLDVYQRAIEFLALACEIVEDLPRGHAERADQLIRAAESVVRNIAEGAGRWTPRDSGKHCRIARGEAMECA